MKEWYKSKTLWLAILQGIAGTLVVLNTQYHEAGYFLLAKTLLDVWIRVITTTEIK